jgi:iron-sulfur cluster repair protein YtfE (RIC family)
MNKPIVRHEALQPLSHDHHQGLLLCMKIRKGIKQGIEPERIKSYSDWFWTNHLVPHFDAEEKFVFPVLPPDHELITRACMEHRRLQSLFEEKDASLKTLTLIADELESHIRFEERILFNEIQEIATPEQLADMERHHGGKVFCDDWKDRFWI